MVSDVMAFNMYSIWRRNGVRVYMVCLQASATKEIRPLKQVNIL